MKSNQCVGFVPKYNNGVPILDNFPFTSNETVESYFETEQKSSYLQLLLLKPMKIGVPSFVLQIFGFDNKFNSIEAEHRHNVGFQLANSIGGKVIGFASDGDARYLRLCLLKSNIGQNNNVPEYLKFFFDGDLSCEIPRFQDMDHMSNKGKNRCFKESEPLVMGKYIISIAILERLIQEADFNDHKLTVSDLTNTDKMSARLAHKLTSEIVEKALEKMSLSDTRGICLYFKCLRYQYEAFTVPELTPIERLYKMAFATFVFRIWRKRVPNKRSFVSHNLYCCFEINFHNLIILIINLRNGKMDEYFMSFLINSQHCESFFRCMRSWAGSQSTRIDGTVFDCLSITREISCTQESQLYMSQHGYVMPKEGKYDKIKNIPQTSLPSDNEINTCLKNCMGQVSRDLEPIFNNIMMSDITVPSDIWKKGNVCETIEDDDESSLEDESSTDTERDTVRKKQFIHALCTKTMNARLNKDRQQRFFTVNNKNFSSEKKRHEKIEHDSTLFVNDFIILDKTHIGCITDFRKNVSLTATQTKLKYDKKFATIDQDLLMRCQLYTLVEKENNYVLEVDTITYGNLFHINKYTTHIPTPIAKDGALTVSKEFGNNIKDFLTNQMDLS